MVRVRTLVFIGNHKSVKFGLSWLIIYCAFFQFGVCYPDINQPDTVNTLECNFLLEEADSAFESWTYWDTASGYTFWDDQGKLKEDLVIFFARLGPIEILIFT